MKIRHTQFPTRNSTLRQKKARKKPGFAVSPRSTGRARNGLHIDIGGHQGSGGPSRAIDDGRRSRADRVDYRPTQTRSGRYSLVARSPRVMLIFLKTSNVSYSFSKERYSLLKRSSALLLMSKEDSCKEDKFLRKMHV